jgi:hypothetical protein
MERYKGETAMKGYACHQQNAIACAAFVFSLISAIK